MATRAAHIPGTFKNRPHMPRKVSPLVPGNEGQWARRIETQLTEQGADAVVCYMMGDCSVIVAHEPTERGFRWHLSIASPVRYPTWDEIKMARYSLPELAGVPLMAQLLPLVEDDGEWVNTHDNCFHLHEVVDG